MTRTRSLLIGSIASLLLLSGLTAGSAHAAGRTSQIRAGIAAELNRRGEVPPNAMYQHSGPAIRISTRKILVTGIIGNEVRAVKWSVPALTNAAGKKLSGTAESQTLILSNLPTSVSDVKVTERPWGTTGTP